MITTRKRLDAFLENYEFYSNSVEFRIISSKALERFKNVQSFQLNEIMNGRYKFGKSRRELLLLKFDLLTKVLYETESLCIQFYHTNVANDVIINSVLSLLSKSSYLYTKIIKEDHPDSFDPVFSKIWLELYDINEHLLRERIKSFNGYNLTDFFNRLVDSVSALLQNSTFELFELDVLLIKQRSLYRNHPDCIYPIGVDNGQPFNTKCSNYGKCAVTKKNIDEDVLDNIKNNLELTKGGSDQYDCNQLMLVVSNCINADNAISKYYIERKMNLYKENFKIDSIFFKNLSDFPINKSLILEIEKLNIPIDYKNSLSA